VQSEDGSDSATNKLYACVVSREDHYTRKDGGAFNADEFESHPERYASTFSHKVRRNILMMNESHPLTLRDMPPPLATR
jgi:hypothetical protein